MFINTTIIETLRKTGHATGAVYLDGDGARTIRLPGAPNMTIITEAVAALTAAGIDVVGYGANLNSPHDDFIGGTIMIAVDTAMERPTDTRSRLRA